MLAENAPLFKDNVDSIAAVIGYKSYRRTYLLSSLTMPKRCMIWIRRTVAKAYAARFSLRARRHDDAVLVGFVNRGRASEQPRPLHLWRRVCSDRVQLKPGELGRSPAKLTDKFYVWKNTDRLSDTANGKCTTAEQRRRANPPDHVDTSFPAAKRRPLDMKSQAMFR
jgi:hypothetical protein